MKALTVARLRQMARALDLSLDDEDIIRLRPMVEDLLEVGRRLRRTQGAGMPRSGPVQHRE